MVNFKALLDSGDFSDLTLTCNGIERRVHRSIICIQSPVLTKMCLGPFKEAISRVIDLSDHSIACLDCLLEFLYTGHYDDCKLIATVPETDVEVPATDLPSYATNAVMYSIGERYDIIPLKRLASAKFATLSYYDSTPEILRELPSLIKLVYTSTPNSDRGLRGVLVDFFEECPVKLQEDISITDLFHEFPDFGADLYKQHLRTWQWTDSALQKEKELTRSALERRATAETENARLRELVSELTWCPVCRIDYVEGTSVINGSTINQCITCRVHYPREITDSLMDL
ncbi:hypothetical protein MMC13_002621 [Lambiella insularis]|nr:hypothetical protein [Lambiella insularis]